jgi:hypothetical protein
LDAFYGKIMNLATAKDHSSYDDFWQEMQALQQV